MFNDDLKPSLHKVKAPRVDMPAHQKKLKKALLKSVYFSESKQKRFKGRFTLFVNYYQMTIKKLIPATLVAMLMFTLVGQYYQGFQNTAYARSLIDETVQNLPTTQSGEEGELSDLELLELMKENGELTHLGEKIHPADPSKKIQQFQLNHEDLSSLIHIDIIDEKEVRIYVEGSRSRSEYFELKTDSQGNILNLKELVKLQDPNLTQPWVKELVKRGNRAWVGRQQTISNAAHKDTYHNQKLDSIMQNIYNQLEEAAGEMTVMITGMSAGYEPEAQKVTASLVFFSLAGQQEKNIEAQAKAQEIIDWLKQFNTPSAQVKIKIMEKALNSSNLELSPNVAPEILLSFPYPGAGVNENLIIRWYEDLSEQEEALSFTFRSEALTVIPGQKGEWVDVWVEDGTIVNQEELKEKLHDPYLEDELLEFIIRQQNQHFLENLKGYQPLSPHLTSSVLEELELILSSANVPIIDQSLSFNKPGSIPKEEKSEGKILLSQLGIYPMGQPEKTEAIEVLDEIMEKMKSSETGRNPDDLNFLRDAQQAKDLKYEGEVKLQNGERGYKVSFVQEGKRMTVILRPETGEYVVVEE